MKRLLTTLSYFCLPLALVAQVTLPPVDSPNASAKTPAPDKDWVALLEARKTAQQNEDTGGADAATRLANRERRISRSKSTADLARSFYTSHPADVLAGEARKLEIFSLIDASESGDGSGNSRLATAVSTLRTDEKVSIASRAQAAAAYDFTHALHGTKEVLERKNVTERVARQLVQEFPEEPQGYEALLAVARSGSGEKTTSLAREIAGSKAPEAYKAEAQRLIDRVALVGQALNTILGGEGEVAGATVPKGAPVIVYSWATWGPGSIELGKMIQARRFAAIGVCLDEELESARQTAAKAGLGGTHVYDAKGRLGALASRLAFSTAGQIYLVDAEGVIRDVRGGEDLETKLKDLGFSTPAIVVPSTAELLRK